MIFLIKPFVFQDDDEGHLTALQILQDLVRKGEHLFLDHFARLGVFSKVSSLAGPAEEMEEEGAVARERKPVSFVVSLYVWVWGECMCMYVDLPANVDHLICDSSQIHVLACGCVSRFDKRRF